MIEEFDELHYLEAPRMLVKPPGPKSKKLLERQEELDSSAVLYPRVIPVAWESAKGATLRDVDGNTYIDLFAGIAVLNVGHSNPYVMDAIRSQLERLVHALDFPTPVRIELLELLHKIAPCGLKGNAKVLLGGPTGTDAMEAAIKLARFNKRRSSIIAFEGGYHGQSAATLGASANRKWKRGYELMPWVYWVPYAYCYRCAFGLEYPDCDMRCARYLRHVIEDPSVGVPEPAAIVIEPIQGEGGVIVPPKGFLKEVERICRENDVLLIADEIQTGFGRTGRMFAVEHEGVTPDMMAMAKALGGIGLPLAGLMISKELDVWADTGHLGTFRGHALGMAAGEAAIRFILEKKLSERAAELGEYILKRLKELSEESKVVGEVRGRGLMIGIEMVEDKDTKKPDPKLAKKIRQECFRRGAIVWGGGYYGNVIRLLPPLVITKELVDKGLDILAETIKESEKRSRYL